MTDYQMIEVHRKALYDGEPDGNAIYIDADKIIAFEDGQVYLEHIAFTVSETAAEISAQITDVTTSPDWLREQAEKKTKDEMLLYMVKKMLGVTND